MKRIFFTLLLVAIFSVSCKKDNNYGIDGAKQDLYESNMAFISSDWTFEVTGDSLKDQIIGLWLSNEVSYNEVDCNECDSLFTWVIESTGRMVKRNNDWGDHETLYGDWKLVFNKKIIVFSYTSYPIDGSNGGGFEIMTDSIKIEHLTKYNLLVSQFIDYPLSTKLDINFNKLK